MCHDFAHYSARTKSKESVASVNCRSVRNKTSERVDYVADNNVDILGLTET